jgi:phenylacetate-CoA ligase
MSQTGSPHHVARPRKARSFYAGMVANVLFPLQEWLKGHRTVAVRKRLEQSQWWPRAQLQQAQEASLQQLLEHASATVPYYRDLFSALQLDPATMHCTDLLQRLPLLTKMDLKARGDVFRSNAAGPLVRSSTGGSSGDPLVFYMGIDRVSHDVAAKWRATRWWGVDIGESELVIWGSPIELKAQDYARAARDCMMRTALMPAFDMSPPRLDDYIARIKKLRPTMLIGYPSAISMIARHAETKRIRLDNIGVQVAFVTAERLYEEQRKLIGRAFGCPVANGYGGRDSGFIAHECPSGGMHVSAEDILVEIVGKDGRRVPDGTSGQIVVTHLASRDFPFIRYATGDVGVLSPALCPCGRTLPMLEQIEGRSTDFVHAEDGTVMHGLALIYILRDIAQIRSFKIIQESTTMTRVLLVAVPSLPVALRQHIGLQFKARLGRGVTIIIDEVAAIEADQSGKYRFVVSKVALP